MLYNIDIDVSNIPENLKFYSDKDMKKRVIVTDNKIRIEDFIGLDDVKNQVKTVYWQWKYETGESRFLINKNDELDSKWMGKDIALAINITGKQVNEKPYYLVNDDLKIGDYVNYDASSGEYRKYETSLEETRI